MTDSTIPELLDIDGVTDTATVIAELARVAAGPRVLAEDTDYAISDADGNVRIEQTPPSPLRTDRFQAMRKLESLESLVGFLQRHGDDGTEVYASRKNTRIEVIIDGASNSGADPDYRFGRHAHRGVLDLQATDSWNAWTRASGNLYDQTEFAEFIEDRADDIVTPTSSEVLEIVQSIQATTDVEFSSSQRLDSGETRIGYAETVKAKAGARGELVIPRELTLALQPFEGVDELHGKRVRAAVTARFRYRLREGHLKLGVKLIGLDRVIDELWQQIVDDLRAQAGGTPVFIGTP
ncbi:MAG: DUF2303 family protein [Pseudoclavibacter sp.]